MKLPNFDEILSHYSEMKGVHPAAEIFPLPNEEDFEALVEDVTKNGLMRPIVFQKDTDLLIDGRSRLMACYIGQIEPRWEETKLDPLSYSMSANLARRNLSVGQKAIASLAYKDLIAKEAKERQSTLNNKETACDAGITSENTGRTREKLAKQFGIGTSSVDMASHLQDEAPGLLEKVKSGDMDLKPAFTEMKKRNAAKPKLEPEPDSKSTIEVMAYDGEIAKVKLPKKTVFNKTNDNVDWAGYTWNPVTGCLHGCKFCYAEEISNMSRMKDLYPLGFKPVFHEYRLDAPKNTKPDGRVFVCSMADLFGKWVPDEWITKVFNACMGSPEWEYMFLTKWPNRYKMLSSLPKAWFGASIIKQADVKRVEKEMQSFTTTGIKWISLEPMLEPIVFNDLGWCDLVVIGSQTAANGEPAFAPEFDWIVDVVNQCRDAGVKYYLKPNLMEIAPGMKLPRSLPI